MKIVKILLLTMAVAGTASSQFVLIEGFEPATYPPTGWTLTYTSTLFWSRYTATAPNGGGYGTSISSSKFDFWFAPTDRRQILTTTTFTPTVAGDSLFFDHAHAFLNLQNQDSLYLEVSTNSGTTWSLLDQLGANPTPFVSLSTTTSLTQYEPLPAHWGTKRYPLPVGTNMIRFNVRSGFGNNLYIDNVRVGRQSAADLGVTGLTKNPGGIIPTGTSTILMATVKNFGSTSQTVVPVSYSVNGGTPVGPVNTIGPIPSNGTEVVTFSGTNAFVPSAPGTYTIRVFTQMPGDGDPSNDTLVLVAIVQTPISTFPYFERFTPPGDWTTSGDFSWGFALGVGSDGTPGDTIRIANFYNIPLGDVGYLRSPLLNLPAALNPQGTTSILLTFYVAHRSFPEEIDFDDNLQVVISTDGGLTFESGSPTLYSRSHLDAPSLSTLPASSSDWVPGTDPFTWRHETVDLTQFAGATNILVAFKGVSGFGNNCFIDNVRISASNNVVAAVVNTPGVVSGNGANLDFISTSPLGSTSVSESAQGVDLMKLDGTPIEPRILSAKNLRIRKDEQRQPGLASSSSGGTVYFSRYSGALPSSASPEFATNTTATTQDASIFTPTVVSTNRWWEITYSGNDYLSTAVYDIAIDITALPGVTNADRLYILKRTDQTGSWVAVSTTHTGNTLAASGLAGFSQFAIGGDVENPLPIQLAYLNAQFSSNGRTVQVNWGTYSEVNNYGFWVEKSQNDQSNYTTIANSFTAGHGTTNEPQHYGFADNDINPGTWWYRLKQQDLNGDIHYSEGVQVEVLTEVKEPTPKVFALMQNYPNPFNPSTEIKFSVEENGLTTLRIYNTLGQEVATLFNDIADAGQYYSVKVNASNFASGMYFYKLQSGVKHEIRRMLLLK